MGIGASFYAGPLQVNEGCRNGICGLFYDVEAKLLVLLQQHGLQDITVWSTESIDCMKKDFCAKTCINFRRLIHVPFYRRNFSNEMEREKLQSWILKAD